MASFKRTMSRAASLLRERASQGATTVEIASALGVHENHAGGALNEMSKAGTVAWHAIGDGICHNRRRWYLPEFKPAAAPVLLGSALNRPRVIKARSTRLNRNQAPAGPAPAPIVCPAFKDTRFAFDPPPGWVGEITRDWQESRLRKVQP